MKSINNKAFTVVELIITFSIVMTISLGLFKVVDAYREKQQQQSFKKEINSYINEVVKVVKDDILKYGIKKIEGTTCTGYNQGIKITFSNNVDKNLCVGKSSDNGIKYGDIFYKVPSKFVIFKEDIIYQGSENYELKKINAIKESKISYLTESFYSINIKINHTELKEDFDINIVAPKKQIKKVDIVQPTTIDEIDSNDYLDKVVYSENYSSVDFTNKFINELDFSDSSLKTVDLSSLSDKNLIINKLITSPSVFANIPKIIESSIINELVFTGSWTAQGVISNWDNVKRITIINSDDNTNIKSLIGAYINELDLTQLKSGKVQLTNTTINKLYISDVDTNNSDSIINTNLNKYTVKKINSLIIVPEEEITILTSISSSLKNKINNLVIDEGITTIKSGVASELGIKNVNLPTTLTDIEAYAFKKNKLEMLDLSNTKLRLIPTECFSYNKIKSVKFPTTLNSIAPRAFIENEGLNCDVISKTCTYNG